MPQQTRPELWRSSWTISPLCFRTYRPRSPTGLDSHLFRHSTYHLSSHSSDTPLLLLHLTILKPLHQPVSSFWLNWMRSTNWRRRLAVSDDVEREQGHPIEEHWSFRRWQVLSCTMLSDDLINCCWTCHNLSQRFMQLRFPTAFHAWQLHAALHQDPCISSKIQYQVFTVRQLSQRVDTIWSVTKPLSPCHRCLMSAHAPFCWIVAVRLIKVIFREQFNVATPPTATLQHLTAQFLAKEMVVSELHQTLA